MGLIDPTGTNKLDENALRLYLINSCGIGKHGDSIVVKKFDNGQSNPTYCVKIGQYDVVIRKKPSGNLLKGAHQVDREYRVMKAVYAAKFPVPKMYQYCSNSMVLGSEFYVMEFLSGKVLGNVMFGLDAKSCRECMFSATKTLADLHNLDPVEIGLSNFGKNKDFCKRVLNTWSKQYRASIVNKINEMESLISYLGEKVDIISDECCLIHGDYSLNNIMFHPNKNQVLAVLDWELSTLGHPLMDIAYFCLQYHMPGIYFTINQVEFDEVKKYFANIPTEDEVLRHYCELRGISYPIPNWNFYLALNFFKLASIVQGVYARSRQGNASSTTASIYGALVEPLASAALTLVERERKMTAMTLSLSPKGQKTLDAVKQFIKNEVDPRREEYLEFIRSAKEPFCVVPLVDELKKKAKAQGLWNLFLCDVSGLSNVDYAHIAEQLGKFPMYSEVFNCNAPDTGNMEVLHMYGSEFQKEKWLKPLMNGEIRSAFCMTEPQVASSDATNMELTITRSGNHFIVNGSKWWSTGAANPRCKIGIVMGRTGDKNTHRHKSHSMIVVPFDTPGVTRVRNLNVFGYNEAPAGHSEMKFDNVRVPVENLILGEGRGFEIAQGRLGPGRIHHCMRAGGLAEVALELLLKRAALRKPFGKRILEHQVVQHQIAESRIAIDQCRLLTLNAASMIDRHGTKKARKEIAMIKIAAPRMLCAVIDRAIQVHGGGGVSQDFPLAEMYAMARTLRIADGPDEVHLDSVGKLEIRDHFIRSRM